MLKQYLYKVSKKLKTRQTTEHSFRGELQEFIESITTGIQAVNEPKRQQCGAPDYIILRKNIPVGYIEAKDIDTDLSTAEKQSKSTDIAAVLKI